MWGRWLLLFETCVALLCVCILFLGLLGWSRWAGMGWDGVLKSVC